MRIIIVGGGAAGSTAAQFARKQSRDAGITVLEETQYPEYSRCGLPHVLSGEIPAFDSLVEFSQEWFQRNKIDLRLSTRAIRISTSAREVDTEGPDGAKTEHFDSLILATGAAPTVPQIRGILSGERLRDGVFQFRGMDDAKRLRDWCGRAKRRVLVVGAGLVGLEVADSLRSSGHDVIVAEYLESALPLVVDSDMTEPVSSAMSDLGVTLLTSVAVEQILGAEKIEGARLRGRSDGSESKIECDTVVLATGQKPSTSLAQDAGCPVGKSGHIIVDDRCQTSIKSIFAIGDCAQFVDFVTGNAATAGLGTLAVRMGEVAGRNAAGGESRIPKGFLNARVTRLFGLEIAATGLLTSSLPSNMRCAQVRVKGSTLPPYYPGGRELLVKLTASVDDGRLLSCQIVGEKEAGLRVNIVSSFMLGGLTVRDLAQFENAYAPPVAPCLDVLATAAQGILLKLARTKPS